MCNGMTNYEICSICKGEYCCQRCGCAYSPDDFKILKMHLPKFIKVRYLVHFLKQGTTSLAHKAFKNPFYGAFDGDTLSLEKMHNWDGMLYLRSRHIEANMLDLKSNKGTCVLWDKATGCTLSYKKRPKSGKSLIPDEATIFENTEYYCFSVYDEKAACGDWSKYADILYEVYLILSEEDYS